MLAHGGVILIPGVGLVLPLIAFAIGFKTRGTRFLRTWCPYIAAIYTWTLAVFLVFLPMKLLEFTFIINAWGKRIDIIDILLRPLLSCAITGVPFAFAMLLQALAIQDQGSGSCPVCGYSLRGLSGHRCPECGSASSPDMSVLRDEHRGFRSILGRFSLAIGLSAMATFSYIMARILTL